LLALAEGTKGSWCSFATTALLAAAACGLLLVFVRESEPLSHRI